MRLVMNSIILSYENGLRSRRLLEKVPPLTFLRFSLTTFSPSGKLVQIEHALAAVAGGTTSLGIKG